MSGKLIRLYDNAAQGAKAAQHLMDEGFESVFHFKGIIGKTAAAEKERKKLMESLVNAHIWKSHADVYAERLSKGGALVLVHAPFGTALDAAERLDSFGPADAGISEDAPSKSMAWDEATPLSSALQLPVLSAIKLPAEMLSGVESLTKGKAFLSDLLGLSLLTGGSSQKSTSMGMPLLSDNPTPLSSLISLRLLSSRATPLSSLFNIPLLTRGR
jgi:hypothetical protein